MNQLLAAANLYLKHVEPETESNKHLINKSISITDQVINEVRQLSWFLVPPILKDLNLKESIESIIPHIALSPTTAEFDIRIDDASLTEGLKINIYRIIQEQFNNIIKYARAEKVKITLSQQEDLVKLIITDNGIGFDQKKRMQGIGFSNIIHRAEMYNGKVNIISSPGHGCTLLIHFKISNPDIGLS